jgi:hypothetical protein
MKNRIKHLVDNGKVAARADYREGPDNLNLLTESGYRKLVDCMIDEDPAKADDYRAIRDEVIEKYFRAL